MKNIRTFNVSPALPDRLKPLLRIAHNLWWVWNHEATELFMRCDMELWEECYHNPLEMLGLMQQDRFKELLEDESFLSHMDRVESDLDFYLTSRSWYVSNFPDRENDCIGYFSMEFGLHESVPIYSGGLGVLAGDHLKSASDLGLPLVGVGLLYREGYFRQYLTADGWQQELYPDNDFSHMPIRVVKDADRNTLLIRLDYPGRVVSAQAWKLQVGRVVLYLLDTNIPENSEEDRAITSRLYGGDHEMRIKQEVLLGIGGYRLLRELGFDPNCCHMNEGHSAFGALEQIRYAMREHSLNFAEALEVVATNNAFTTHTPVPAGNDVFPNPLMETYFGEYVHQLGIDMNTFLGLGKQNPHDPNENFCMTVLALRLAGACNGVSQLHGEVSRAMWQRIWPDLPVNELPIFHITNGIHLPTWISYDMSMLLDRYLGRDWRYEPEDEKVWARVDSVPDAELWRTHERRRERLVAFSRKRLSAQLKSRGAPPSEIARADEVLDPEVLTIGFARRFATYKRGTLILSDIERLLRLLNDEERPLQLIFAGKAHPHDVAGKELIQQIVRFAQRDDVRNRLVFLEDYDANVAHYLVQGVDIWLNTPRRNLEASGTSGMKVIANGGLNLSILDGWWVEGWNGDNGWAIGRGEEYEDLNYADHVESQALFNLLEHEIVPLFYDRKKGIPRGWIRRMKRSMATLGWQFNTHRMVEDYVLRSYHPGMNRKAALLADNGEPARELARWRRSMYMQWVQINVEEVNAEKLVSLKVGDELAVSAVVHLGEIQPGDVRVELFYGGIGSSGDIEKGQSLGMTIVKELGSGRYRYEGRVPLVVTGKNGFTVRITPDHDLIATRFIPGLIAWG